MGKNETVVLFMPNASSQHLARDTVECVENCKSRSLKFEPGASQLSNRMFDIVGTVYHLVIYMQSNKIHKVFQ